MASCSQILVWAGPGQSIGSFYIRKKRIRWRGTGWGFGSGLVRDLCTSNDQILTTQLPKMTSPPRSSVLGDLSSYFILSQLVV